MTSTSQSPLTFGEDAVVYDSSGEELGRVAEVKEGYFKVNVSMASDYWLPLHTVARIEGTDRVHLRCSGDELDEAKVDASFEDLSQTEIDESLSPTGHPAPVEQRYANEADYLKHPHQPL